MMAYDKSNTLVIRKVGDTLAQSCYALLKKCAYNLGVAHKWKFSKSPLEMVYIPTGQKIIFRGLDDPQKITSIDVEYGSLCWMWVEEAYQITKKEDFDRIDESIRGRLPDGLFKRIMLTFNPWNKSHWLRTAFFETEEGKPLDDKDVFAHTTNYLMNEWLEPADYRLYERMKRLNPRQYHVAGLGNWGSPEGLIYDGNWEEFEFDYNEVAQRPGVVAINGLDFGFSADPTAMACMLYDEEHYELYIYDEMYVKGYTSPKRYEEICRMGHKHSVIYYDSAGALDSGELMELGLSNLIPYNKAGEKNSILNGINFLRNLTIYIHPKCVNFITEIENYMWYIDKDGNTQSKPQPGSMDHLMDACIRKGAMVVTIDGNVPIEQIRAGDKVLTHYGYQTVLSAGKTGHKRIWRLMLSNGMTLEATDNHPVLTSDGFIRMDAIKYGVKVAVWNTPKNMSSTTGVDSIFTIMDFVQTDASPLGGEEWVSMTSNAFVRYAERNSQSTDIPRPVPVLADVLECYATDIYDDVYNLEVENSHTYIADGIVVHNCRYGVMGYRQSSGGGYIGGTDESEQDEWKQQYQYELLTDDEIEQRKKEVAIRDKREDEVIKEEPDDDDDDGLSWCYST